MTFSVGTKVRLTGRFLRSTGQYTGGDTNGRWLIVACDCELCKGSEHCAVNEPALDYGQWDDIPKEERPKWRHFAIANLKEVGKPLLTRVDWSSATAPAYCRSATRAFSLMLGWFIARA